MMMRTRKSAASALAGAVIVSSILAAAPSLAQDAARAGETKAEPIAVCMVRAGPDVAIADVAKASERKALPQVQIIATDRSAKAFEAKGFVRTECQVSKLAGGTLRQDYRDEVCELAAYGTEAVQNRLEQVLGERPAVLCANAQLAVGKWERRSTKARRGPPTRQRD